MGSVEVPSTLNPFYISQRSNPGVYLQSAQCSAEHRTSINATLPGTQHPFWRVFMMNHAGLSTNCPVIDTSQKQAELVLCASPQVLLTSPLLNPGLISFLQWPGRFLESWKGQNLSHIDSYRIPSCHFWAFFDAKGVQDIDFRSNKSEGTLLGTVQCQQSQQSGSLRHEDRRVPFSQSWWNILQKIRLEHGFPNTLIYVQIHWPLKSTNSIYIGIVNII